MNPLVKHNLGFRYDGNIVNRCNDLGKYQVM
jgi:hypothetical protein